MTADFGCGNGSTIACVSLSYVTTSTLLLLLFAATSFCNLESCEHSLNHRDRSRLGVDITKRYTERVHTNVLAVVPDVSSRLSVQDWDDSRLRMRKWINYRVRISIVCYHFHSSLAPFCSSFCLSSSTRHILLLFFIRSA
jgi:hypothetical protein